MAIGEAAGVTAALACENDSAIGEVAFAQVQRVLLDHGGILS